MPSFLIPALFAAGGGIANFLSGQAASKQQNQNIKTAQGLLRENLVDEGTLESYIRNINMSFNSSLANVANQGAIRSRGVANQAVVAAATLAPLEGNRLNAISDAQLKVDENNRQVNSQIAQLSLGQAPNDPVGDFFSGAIPGLTAGMEVSKYADFMTDNTDMTDQVSNFTESTTSAGNSDSPYQYKLGGRHESALNLNMKNPYIDYLDDTQFNMRNRFRFFN